MQAGQGEHPQRVGVHLHPLAEVVHQSVAGQQIVDDPEVDEGVLVDPPVDPGPDQHHRHRYEDRPPTGQSGSSLLWGWAAARSVSRVAVSR